MIILTILSLSIHRHGLSFHLFVSSLIFLAVFCSFECMSLLPPLLSLFLSILSFFFGAVVNGIVFLISFLDWSLLVKRNTTNFCVLILYPETLLKLFLVVTLFFLGFLVFSTYQIMSSVNRDNFTSSFPVSFFMSKLLWLELPHLLNSIGKIVYSCLLLHLRGQAFSSLPLNMLLAIEF